MSAMSAMPDVIDQEPAGIGDNNPPSALVLFDEALETADHAAIQEMLGRLADHLATDSPTRKAKRDEMLRYFDLWEHGGELNGSRVEPRPECRHDEDAAKATSLAERLRAIEREEEAARKAAKGLFDKGGKTIQSAFTPRISRLTIAREKMTGRVTRHQRRKADERRREQEEANRKAREAEQARLAAELKAAQTGDMAAVDAARQAEDEQQEAAAKAAKAAADKAQVRGTSGAMATTQTVYSLRVVDLAKVPREYLVLDEKKALAALKAKIAVPGLQLVEDERTVIR